MAKQHLTPAQRHDRRAKDEARKAHAKKAREKAAGLSGSSRKDSAA